MCVWCVCMCGVSECVCVCGVCVYVCVWCVCMCVYVCVVCVENGLVFRLYDVLISTVANLYVSWGINL